MKQSIGLPEFEQAFIDYNRGNNFSCSGLEALFNWLEECYEDGDGGEYALDVIGLCCDFTEYPSAKEALKEYGEDVSEYDGLGVEWLQDRTTVIPFDTGIIIQAF